MIKGSVKIPTIRSGSKLITAISSSLDKDYYPAFPPNLTEIDFLNSVSSAVFEHFQTISNFYRNFSDTQSVHSETLIVHKQDYTSWDYFSEAYTGTIVSL